MHCSLLFTAIYAFSAFVIAAPNHPASVTKIIVETTTFIERQVTDPTGPSINTTELTTDLANASTTASTTDPVAASIASLLSLLVPASSVTAMLASALPPPYLEWLTGSDVLAWVQAAADGEETWIYRLPDPVYNWIVSEADKDATILPQIESLQSIQMSTALAALSEMASLSDHPFTFTTSLVQQFSTITAYPTPTPTPTPTPKPALTTGAKIGLGIGIPALVLLLCALAFVAFIVHQNRYRVRGVQLYDRIRRPKPTKLEPFPWQNESTKGAGISSSKKLSKSNRGPDLRKEMTEKTQEYDSGYVTKGEPKQTRNSVSTINRKPVGSLSSNRVVPIEGVPTSEQNSAVPGSPGYMTGADDGRIEDEGFAEAVEMPAAPVGKHTQHTSSTAAETGSDTDVVEGNEKKESFADGHDQPVKVGTAK